MAQLGGQSIYMGPVELQNGKREAPKDLAKVLSRYLDGFIARTFAHKDVEELAREATVPVINGLSDFEHPCQALSDLFTIQEKLGKVRGIRIAFVGDGNNVCHSLLMGCALLGARLSVATPASHRPDPKVVGWSQEMAKRQAGQILLSQDPQKAVRSARIVYTDVWASMGQEHQRERRRKIFRKFQVNRELLKEAPGALFMHCLPAHRGEEVTDEVIDSKRSIVYDQAENRLHLQKAILLNLL